MFPSKRYIPGVTGTDGVYTVTNGSRQHLQPSSEFFHFEPSPNENSTLQMTRWRQIYNNRLSSPKNVRKFTPDDLEMKKY